MRKFIIGFRNYKISDSGVIYKIQYNGVQTPQDYFIYNFMPAINLRDRDKTKFNQPIHLLLAQAFIKDYDPTKHGVLFKDGDIFNLSVQNLEICPKEYHTELFERSTYIKPIRRAFYDADEITIEKYKTMLDMAGCVFPHSTIMQETGCSIYFLLDVRKGRRVLIQDYKTKVMFQPKF